MGEVKERRSYGDVIPWSDEVLEQYCRDIGFPPQSLEAEQPLPDDGLKAVAREPDREDKAAS
jgi:hypothetical protein